MPSLEGLQVAKGKRRAPAEAAKDESAEGSRRRKRREEPRAQHGTFGTFTINLPKPSRPMSLAEDIDPLSSPGQLEQMLSICESYNRWLLPSNSDETTAAQVSGPWDNTTSQMLLFALCLKSIGHLDALHPSQSGGNKRLFKTRVLALANKRLKHPAKALEDKTIGALACLTSYEVCQFDLCCLFCRSTSGHSKALKQRLILGVDLARLGRSDDAFARTLTDH